MRHLGIFVQISLIKKNYDFLTRLARTFRKTLIHIGGVISNDLIDLNVRLQNMSLICLPVGTNYAVDNHLRTLKV